MRVGRLLGKAILVGGTARSIYQAQRVWRNARRTLIPPDDPPPVTERVSVLMPARDEAHRISPGVRSLVAQRGVDDLEILVLDDNSTDGTSEAVLAAAGGDPRLHVLTGRPLPEGWRGKPHACAQLSEAASGSVLVFVDADVTFEPHAMAAAIALMRSRHLDWISPYPRQVTGSLAEYLLQPLTAWTRLSMVDMRHAEDSLEHGSLLANGQFIVVDTAAYQRAGGHAVIPDAIIDDLWLASVLKATGSRGVAVEGSGLASCRMYDGFADLRDGYARWIWILFPTRRHLVLTCLQLAASELAPPLAALRGSKIGLIGYAAAVTGRVVSGRASRDRIFPWVLASPVSAAVSAFMYVYSVRRAARGQLSWKGRAVQ
ncbi:glycosyltransferase family 2 protein [Sporichthya sp.]|uniref:glycosyltransferase n=1 Tax=Sporichthya sp. TaxID=65475 RepID=UPI0017BCA0E0|nr:glycosyltransferase family 2 protein [Sporichthya sp.]MBA3742402.1 glycosyltransferase [Sporichthya sp.]